MVPGHYLTVTGLVPTRLGLWYDQGAGGLWPVDDPPSPNGPQPEDPPMEAVQYVSDESGQTTAVLVPIDLWREIASEKETAYLLSSEAMKRRLLEAMKRTGGTPLETARGKLGI